MNRIEQKEHGNDISWSKEAIELAAKEMGITPEEVLKKLQECFILLGNKAPASQQRGEH